MPQQSNPNIPERGVFSRLRELLLPQASDSCNASGQPRISDAPNLSVTEALPTLHRSSAFFQGANGVDSRGGQYYIIHGNQIVNTTTPIQEFLGNDESEQSPSAGTTTTETSSQYRSSGSANAATNTDTMLALPSLLQTQRSCDIYYRHLAIKGRGTPLWFPGPNLSLSIEYRKNGADIGDVGLITSSGGFDFLFNISLPPDHPIHAGHVPGDFAPLCPPIRAIDIFKQFEFGADAYLVSSSVKEAHHPANQANLIRGLTFETKDSEGAILTMPQGSHSIDLRNVKNFRQYLAQNAESWYQYVNSDECGREANNGDLRLVTGCDKTKAWGMATFSRSSSESIQQVPFWLNFKPHLETSGRTYKWETSGSIEGRTGPSVHEIDDLRSANEPGDVTFINQCLFIRAMSVSLAEHVWERLEKSNSGAIDAKIPTASNVNENARTRNVHARGSQLSASDMTTNLSYHPATVLNAHLLQECPDTRVAVTEDINWMSVLNENDHVLPSSQQFLQRIIKNYDICKEEGFAYLTPKEINVPKIAFRTTDTESCQTSLHALLIGINTYNDHKSTTGTRGSLALTPEALHLPQFSDLYGAVPDAERFQTYLLSTLKIDPTHITLLLNERATRKNIIDAFQQLANNNDIKQGDSIFIFYAGHGAQAFPPQMMLDVDGCPDHVELLIPYDYGKDPKNHQNMGIPDYTLAALLDKIAKVKGDNITIIFDCCHSASALRGMTPTNTQNPESQPITRSGPELKYRVPDELDHDIWGGMRGAGVLYTLKHTGTNPYVFFSACKSDELAKEQSKQGYFTRALLELLENLGPNVISCSEIITRLQKKINGQNPQCKGLHSENRPIFQGYSSPFTKKFFKLIDKENTLTLMGGDVHGFCEGDQLAVYKNNSNDHKEASIATVEITKVFRATANLKLVSNSGFTFSLGTYPKAAAALLKNVSKGYLKVYVGPNDLTLVPRLKALTLCTLTDAYSAHIAISVDATEKQLRFDVVDQDLLGKKPNLAFKPRFIPDTDEDLAHVMKGLAHYYYHLKRTSASLNDVIKKVSVSFFEVRDTSCGHPRVVRVDGARNLCEKDVIDIEVIEDSEAIYGFEVTNNTDHDEILFPVLFYFDNTDFTISKSYPHTVIGEKMESSWPARGHSLTIGYGVGAGSTVHPFGFYVGEDHKMEAGFFKLFLLKNQWIWKMSYRRNRYSREIEGCDRKLQRPIKLQLKSHSVGDQLLWRRFNEKVSLWARVVFHQCVQ